VTYQLIISITLQVSNIILGAIRKLDKVRLGARLLSTGIGIITTLLVGKAVSSAREPPVGKACEIGVGDPSGPPQLLQ